MIYELDGKKMVQHVPMYPTEPSQSTSVQPELLSDDSLRSISQSTSEQPELRSDDSRRSISQSTTEQPEPRSDDSRRSISQSTSEQPETCCRKQKRNQNSTLVSTSAKLKPHIQQLLQAWNNGMTHADSPLVSKVAETSGLEISQVKNWIGNYRRKMSGRPGSKKRLRQPSGYNLFCREIASKTDEPLEKCARRWGQTWNLLPQVQKDQYIETAQREVTEQHSTEEKIKKNIKQISSCFQNLNALGVDGFSLLFIPGADDLRLQGTNKGVSFISRQADIHRDFCDFLRDKNAPDTSLQTSLHQTSLHQTSLHQTSLHQTSLHQTSLHQTSLQLKGGREALRSRVQELFNKKYKEAHGPGSKLSYKKGACVEGLPTGLILKKPSSYGSPSLKAILAAEDRIKFKKMDIKNIPGSSSSVEKVTLQPVPQVEHKDFQFLQNEAEKGLCSNMHVGEETPDCNLLSDVAKQCSGKQAGRGRERKAENQRKRLPRRRKSSATV